MWLGTAKTQTLINEQVGKEIVFRGGLMQGDPLSPHVVLLSCGWTESHAQKAREEG